MSEASPRHHQDHDHHPAARRTSFSAGVGSVEFGIRLRGGRVRCYVRVALTWRGSPS